MKKIVKCLNCNKEMELNPSCTKKFCSIECRSEYRRKQTPEVEFTCEQCGQKFRRPLRAVKMAEKKGQPIRYCSMKCKREAWGNNRIEKVCPVCGKKFLTQAQYVNRHMTCSSECAKKNPYSKNKPKKRTSVLCRYCGKWFQVDLSYAIKQRKRGQEVKFCCREHALAGTGRAIRPIITSTCEWCGKEFEHKDNKPQKFCSEECRNAYKTRDTITRICKQCGKEFTINGYKYKVQHAGIYCSLECRDKARKIEHDTYAKLQHYLRSSAEYEQWRIAILNRANLQCEECGAKGELHAHHLYELYKIAKDNDFDEQKILASEKFNDISNGVCLCTACHIKKHPYHKELRNKKGQFCRREFKPTNQTHEDQSGIKLEGE